MNYIDGKFQNGSGDQLRVYDKYTKEEIGSIQMASEPDVIKAINSANTAFGITKHLSAGERKHILHSMADKLLERKEIIVQTIVAEAGKPVDYANTELVRAEQTLRLAAENAIRFEGEKLNIDYGMAVGRTAFTQYMPMGVIAGITPFNFPLNLMMHKVAPAIATGNSIIIKPASSTPLTAVEFAKIIDGIDIPRGMFNLVITPGSKMNMIVESERVQKISFTGSDKVGWGIKARSGKKHVTLELGGNAPVIIDKNANLEKAAKEVAYGVLLYAGQICISTQRIIIVDEIYQEFRDRLIAEVETTKFGNPHEAGTVSGSLISEQDLVRINEWVNEAKASGGKLLTGGEYNSEHNLYHPTLIENAADNSKVIRDEVFGPLGVLQRAKNFAEAVNIANDTRFGLQCGVYTDSLENMKLSQNELRYGGVIFNSVPGFRMDAMPYGGVGDSGFGREGIKYAMESMVETKLIVY